MLPSGPLQGGSLVRGTTPPALGADLVTVLFLINTLLKVSRVANVSCWRFAKEPLGRWK